jgi:hypothetical protein
VRNGCQIEGLLEYSSATDVLLEFLYCETALNEDTDVRDTKRSNDPQHGPLNRHGVLHGKDLDYPTQPNSFRAIVLLGYLQQMQMFLEVKKEVKQQVEEIFRTHGCIAFSSPKSP